MDQFGQLGRHILLRDTLGQLPGRDAPGGKGNIAHRVHATTHKQRADDGRQQRGRDNGQPEIMLQLLEKFGVVTISRATTT